VNIDDIIATLNGPGPWIGFALGLGARTVLASVLRALALRLRLRAQATPDKADDVMANVDARVLEDIAKSVTVLSLKDKRPTGGK
jgi:SH3-like domain-containing protein